MRMFAVIGLGFVLATQAGAAPAPITVNAPGMTYHISPGDQLDIYVWGDERLQRSLSVLPDGTFAFPLAGTVHAAGRTPTDIEGELSKRLASQYKGEAPQVTVSVKVPSGMQVSVIGKVRAPGTFTPTRYVTVLDILAMAGGPTDFADVSNIVILRKDGGKTSVIHAKLGGLLKGKPSSGDLSMDGMPQLMAGDTVIVP
jgi:polysaccharide biosynthesis/export protein